MKTQSALAERIADIEDLEAAPKDLVNRAFRELPVELTSLERIARGLGVPAHTLYLTADEVTDTGTNLSERKPTATRYIIASLGTVLLGLVVYFGWTWPSTPTANHSSITDADFMLSLGDLHIVVTPIVGDDGAMTRAIRERLEQNFNVASNTATLVAPQADVRALAERLRADIVIEGSLIFSGRLSGFTAFAYFEGVRQQIWAETFPSVELPMIRTAIADRLFGALLRRINTQIFDAPYFPLEPVLQDYLAGEALLDQPANELNLKRAQSRFEAALRQDQNYAQAYAGLCQALLEQHWMFEEDRMLRDASTACSRALILDPEHPVVASAHAHFLSRTGRVDEAIALYEQVAGEFPTRAAAFEGLAAVKLDAYRQTGSEQQLVEAKLASRQAADVDPYVWKPLFNLATMEWFSGDTETAIEVLEEARARQENEYILGNLGTFYICKGDFSKAKESYQRAQEIAPQSYVGDEFLGMTHYFLGEYEEAVRLRRRAIRSIGDGAPEIHEMWGHLADALRMSGASEEAAQAYQRAVEIAERDYLQGNAPVADRAARAYYYLALQNLKPGSLAVEIEDHLASELDSISQQIIEPTAHRRMAQIWILRGDLDKAKSAVRLATTKCPGYGMLPEFTALR